MLLKRFPLMREFDKPKSNNLRMPGVEPGSQAWEACMMPLHYMRFFSLPQVEYCKRLEESKSERERERARETWSRVQ